VFVLQSYIEKNQNDLLAFSQKASVAPPNGKIYRNSKQENSLIFGLERNKKESEEVKKLFLDIVCVKIDIINSNNNS